MLSSPVNSSEFALTEIQIYYFEQKRNHRKRGQVKSLLCVLKYKWQSLETNKSPVCFPPWHCHLDLPIPEKNHHLYKTVTDLVNLDKIKLLNQKVHTCY